MKPNFVDSSGNVLVSFLTSGSYTFTTPGVYYFNQTYMGNSNSFSVPGIVGSIIILPSDPVSVLVGSTTSFTASAYDHYGNVFDAPTGPTWNSSNPSVGTIDANGVFTALSSGTTDITASISSVSSNPTTITVTGNNTILTSITAINVTPSNATVALGSTQTFSLTDQDNNPLSTTTAWTNSDDSIGTIDPANGLFTASSTGTTIITATAGTLTASTTVIVSASASTTDTTGTSTSATSTPAVSSSGAGGAINGIPPVIVVIGDNPLTIAATSTYIDAGAKAFDSEDNTITQNIITTSNVNSEIAGTYSVKYSVTDSRGNTTSATRTVNVINATTTSSVPSSATSTASLTASSAATSANTSATTTVGVFSTSSNPTITSAPALTETVVAPKATETRVSTTSESSSTVMQTALTPTNNNQLATASLGSSQDLLEIILSLIATLLAAFGIYKVQKN